MKNQISKIVLVLMVLFVSIKAIGQKEIKPPELDTKKNTYTLNFSPDPKDERVTSAYMKGTTEADSLRFWAEGTVLLQSVMVTVITTNKDDKIKVDIVKDHWEDSKINGYTKNGLFQESFDTANKFGIVITSEKPDIPFHLAVWTTGEHKPNMATLYYPASEGASTQGGKMTNTNLQTSKSLTTGTDNNNTLMYLVIGVLVLIAILLILLVLKKKSSKILSILVCFFLGQQLVLADADFSNASDFNIVLDYAYNHADTALTFMENANSVSNEIQRQLSPSDSESRPQVDPAGGPRLPSSCYAVASMDSRTPRPTQADRGLNSEGCTCLDRAYMDLNKSRLNLERLRIIYAHAMKKINAGIAFGDNVSGVHGVSGLVWQSQKMIILRESIPTLNRAYDDKYAEMIQALEERLRKIEECEVMMGNENWYSNAGFIYYTFMADKYKRN